MRLVSPLAGASLALASLTVLVPSTYAVDGVVLIDQAAVLAGGVTPGDGPGFPLQITQPGSYRLSSDLVAPAGPNGTAIWIESSDVTLDLNGFNVLGAGYPFTDGIFIFGFNVEIRNGTVRGFGRHGIFSRNGGKSVDDVDSEGLRLLNVRAVANGFNGIRIESQGALVDGCSAANNGNAGINAQGQGSLVKNSVSRVNKTYGFIGGSNTGFRSNVATANNGGDLNPQVLGGMNLGDNLCGTVLCP